jgi:hypothetical protein
LKTRNVAIPSDGTNEARIAPSCLARCAPAAADAWAGSDCVSSSRGAHGDRRLRKDARGGVELFPAVGGCRPRGDVSSANAGCRRTADGLPHLIPWQWGQYREPRSADRQRIRAKSSETPARAPVRPEFSRFVQPQALAGWSNSHGLKRRAA